MPKDSYLSSIESAADVVVEEQTRDTAQRIRGNVNLAVGKNPDQEAEVLKLANDTGVPLDVAREKKDELKNKVIARSVDAENIARNKPATAKLLTDNTSVSLAIDDIANMESLEDAANPHKYGVDIRPEASIGSVLGYAGGALPEGAQHMYYGAKAQFADSMGWNDVAADAIRQAQELRFERSLDFPKIESETGKAALGGLSSFVGFQIPALATALITRRPAAGLALMEVQTSSEAYTRYREQGSTPLQAFAGAHGVGMVEVLTEMLPMKTVMNAFGKKGGGKFIKEFFVKEAFGEQIATVLQEAIDTAMPGGGTWEEYFQERPDAAYATFISTLVSTGLTTGVIEGSKRALDSRMKADRARMDSEQIGNLVQLSEANKLRERSTDSFKQFIEDATEDGPVENLFIDPNVFNQDGIELDELGELPEDAQKEIAEAMSTGRDAKIKTSDFATYLSGTAIARSLMPHLKTSPSGMSQAEAEDYMKNEGEIFQNEVQKVLIEKEKDASFNISRDNVESNMLEQMRGTKRFTDDVNKPKAKLAANYYATLGARLGITPEEAFAKYPVSVESNFSGGMVLDQKTRGLDDIKAEWNREGVFLGMSPRGDKIRLDRIEVDPGKRNGGLAREAMQDLIDHADSLGKVITLDPTDEFGANLPQLKEFYKNMGFVENKKIGNVDNRDFEITEAMYRKPKDQRRKPAVDPLVELQGEWIKGEVIDKDKTKHNARVAVKDAQEEIDGAMALLDCIRA